MIPGRPGTYFDLPPRAVFRDATARALLEGRRVKVLVTGSRKWSDGRLLEWVLDSYEEELGQFDMIVGDARGADELAFDWAVRHDQPTPDVHIARWKQYGRGAGVMRNAEMVSCQPDLVIGFFEPGAANVGTTDCCTRAAAVGIHVDRYPKG